MQFSQKLNLMRKDFNLALSFLILHCKRIKIYFGHWFRNPWLNCQHNRTEICIIESDSTNDIQNWIWKTFIKLLTIVSMKVSFFAMSIAKGTERISIVDDRKMRSKRLRASIYYHEYNRSQFASECPSKNY